MNSNHLGLFDLTGKVPTSCATAAAVTSRDAEILRLKEELVIEHFIFITIHNFVSLMTYKHS